MESMSSVERVIRTMEGKPVDRVPVFCPMMDTRTAYEVLGKPLFSGKAMMNWRITRFLFDNWGTALTDLLFMPNLIKTVDKRNRAGVEMGFDATWVWYPSAWKVLDHERLAFGTGSIYRAMDDGYGEITYVYDKPGFVTPADFDAWPYWPDSDTLAHDVYNYFKKFMKYYGERSCVFGMGFVGGFQENMNWSFGIGKVPLWIRRHPGYVKRFLDIMEELITKASVAVMDAGVKVVLLPDDSAFKSGPFLNPKTVEELFGPGYRRIYRMVHDRGAKVVVHSCGDNTLLFDLFIGWGADGLHAYETTSNVDIFNEKKIHGDRVTIIGGMGIDYLLTDRSRDEEVVEKVRKLIEKLAPGGRFILSPVHGEASIPAHKLRVMLNAAHTYGRYGDADGVRGKIC
jgi:hypothetical protein